MPTHAGSHPFGSFQCFQNKFFPKGRPGDMSAQSRDTEFLAQTWSNLIRWEAQLSVKILQAFLVAEKSLKAWSGDIWEAQKPNSKINLLPPILTLQAFSYNPEEWGQCHNLGRPERLWLTVLLILEQEPLNPMRFSGLSGKSEVQMSRNKGSIFYPFPCCCCYMGLQHRRIVFKSPKRFSILKK